MHRHYQLQHFKSFFSFPWRGLRKAIFHCSKVIFIFSLSQVDFILNVMLYLYLSTQYKEAPLSTTVSKYYLPKVSFFLIIVNTGENSKMGKIAQPQSLPYGEGLGAGGKGDDRGWDGWTASPTRWTWVWVNSGSWWWTGKPGVLRFMGSQRVRHDWAIELNWVLSWHFTPVAPLLMEAKSAYQEAASGTSACLEKSPQVWVTLEFLSCSPWRVSDADLKQLFSAW